MQHEVKDSNESAVFTTVELSVEELEAVIAPRIAINHNETLVSDEIGLDVEDLEEVIAPKIALNHNETLAGDEIELDNEELYIATANLQLVPPTYS